MALEQDVIDEIKKDSNESFNDFVITAGEGILVQGHSKDWIVQSDPVYVKSIFPKYTLQICVNGVPKNIDVLVGSGTQPYPLGSSPAS